MAKNFRKNFFFTKRGIISALLMVVAFLFVVFFIYFDFNEIRAGEKKIAELKHLLKEQKALLALQEALEKNMDRKKKFKFAVLPKARVKPDDISGLSAVFSAKASKTRLALVDCVSGITEFTKETTRLPVKIVLEGDFFHFRDFMIELGKLEFLAGIERLEIDTKPETKRYYLDVFLYLK